MCKYCKRLKELLDKEKKDNALLIKAWKLQCYHQEQLLKSWCKKSVNWLYSDPNDSYEQLWLQERTSDIIKSDIV